MLLCALSCLKLAFVLMLQMQDSPLAQKGVPQHSRGGLSTCQSRELAGGAPSTQIFS